MNIEFLPEEITAVRLYQGCGLPEEQDAFYQQNKAYYAFNLFMMEGQDGERVRICAEGQHPNIIYIQRWTETLDVLVTLFQVQCKYACQQRTEGKSLPNPLVRGDRKVNFDQMYAAGGTIAFTSTSQNVLCEEFLEGKQDPHVLHITLGEKVPYLDFEDFFGSANGLPEEHEVLLPPGVSMACGRCWKEIHEGIGIVSHYDVVFNAFNTNIEMENEDLLIDVLNTNKEAAAIALSDLVDKKLDSCVLKDDSHIYWKWKTAFRKLALQRMVSIYECYFA